MEVLIKEPCANFPWYTELKSCSWQCSVQYLLTPGKRQWCKRTASNKFSKVTFKHQKSEASNKNELHFNCRILWRTQIKEGDCSFQGEYIRAFFAFWANNTEVISCLSELLHLTIPNVYFWYKSNCDVLVSERRTAKKQLATNLTVK